ncbi:MAG: hypothetical protein ACJ8IK_01980 [Burkholderiaceae bacterium]
MNSRAAWALAQEEYRAARDGIAALEQAVPAFRGQARAFRAPIEHFLASDAATTAGGLAQLARTLTAQAEHLSSVRRAISSHVATAKASLERYQAHLRAADDGRDAFRQLQRIVEGAARGISETEDLIADADRLLQEAAAHLLEGALKFDLPPAAEQLARQLIDRART